MSQQGQPIAPYYTEPGPLEMARLIWQSKVIGEAAGGPLPELQDVTHIHEVLDLACGTGEWALRLVRTYPFMQVTGVDISEVMIRHAQTQAENDHLAATFKQMNILEWPLSFPDASFDLINIRLIFAFMKREMWLPLLKECLRILRPGGFARIVESDIVLSNDEVMREYTRWWVEAFHHAGNTFALKEDGSVDLSCPYYGITLPMANLLEQAGCAQETIFRRSFDVNFSYGKGAYRSMMEDLLLSFRTGAKFLREHSPSIMTKSDEEAREALQDARAYLQMFLDPPGKPGFVGYWHLASTIGQKPEHA